MTCRYCGESYAANATTDCCPKCGAPSAAGDAKPPKRRAVAVTAQDFQNVGLQSEWNQPRVEHQDGSTWISYTSKTGGEGGIEIDILDGGPDAEEVFMLEQLELGAHTKIALSGADDAGVNVKGKGPAAALIFRRGPSVVVFRIPRGPNAGQQLAALAALFIQRVPGTAAA